MSKIDKMIECVYESMEGNEQVEKYHHRHGVKSAGILTVTNDETAEAIARYLEERIRGKVVVEIGGGIGLLAMHMAMYAARVFVIEADPMWTSMEVAMFYKRKPKNVTFIFGAADEMAGHIKADVALFCTHSAAKDMRRAAMLFAPQVIDVYGEIVPKLSPELAALDPLRDTENGIS